MKYIAMYQQLKTWKTWKYC